MNVIERTFRKGSNSANRLLRYYLITHFGADDSKCSICGISEWQGQAIVMDLDHIDGDSTNNETSNLRFLCPNCHSQTSSYRGRNINSGKTKVTDDQLIKALKGTNSIRQALNAVGLSARGGNYTRAYKLLAKQSIS